MPRTLKKRQETPELPQLIQAVLKAGISTMLIRQKGPNVWNKKRAAE